MSLLVPRPVLQQDPPAPKALAPAWARLAIGVAAGASIAPLVLADAKPFDREPALIALFVALIGFAAALAADLDRRRPRPWLALGIGAVYGLPTFVLAGGMAGEHSFLAVLLTFAIPFAGGALRARVGRERRPLLRGLVSFAFTLAFVVAGGALAVASGVRLPGAEMALLGGVAGAAATAGLVAAGWGLREAWPVAARRTFD